MELTACYIIRPVKFIGREVESYFSPTNRAVGIQPEQVSSGAVPAAHLPLQLLGLPRMECRRELAANCRAGRLTSLLLSQETRC